MAQPTYQELLELVALKDRQIARLEACVARLEARIAELEQRLEKATRENKRQAAPFSKGPPKDNPKKPGRKGGKKYGLKTHRPLPERKPNEIIDVPLPKQCRDCGGDIEEQHVDRQYQVEIPRRATVRRFDIHVGRCRCCGQRIRPRHPLQTSDATGAAASQLGPDAQAMIALLKNKYGLSYGNICGLFKDGFGIPISRGGAARVVLRAADRSEAVYDTIRDRVRRSEVVYPDETGWKVGGRLQWLWVFVTDRATAYVIRPSRGYDVPEDMLGADYDGCMVHDGWSPYDRFTNAVHQQCLAHLLRRANELLEQACRGAGRFPRKVKAFIQDALALRDRRRAGTISPHGLAVARGRLENRLTRLLASRLSHKANRRFQAHLRKHGDEILTFLYDPAIEATNWPAEQALRPAVVNRKVFGGNRTAAGAHAQEILASLFATCVQWQQEALAFLSSLLCSPTPQPNTR